jgi:hypothetical protein
MKNRVASILTLGGLLVVLAVANAQAQVPTKVVVRVPFDFTAGKTTLKLGTYTIRQTNGLALLIKSADGGKGTLIAAPLAIGSEAAKGGERLVFNRYGEQYFLSQIWWTANSGRQLYPSKLENKTAHEFLLAHKDAKPERVEIAIR